jgi:hypothetical protein
MVWLNSGEGRTAPGGTPIAFPDGMWLDAIVTSADLKKVLDQLTPVKVPLGSRGHLFFDAPVDVSLVADRGLRVRCHAKLLWPVLGIDVGITVSSMTILVVPSIEARDGERVIVLAPEVEALDLALLPDIGDAELRGFINRELQEKRVELPWNYRHTLDHQIPLPDWFRTGAMFDIRSDGAAVKVTNDSIGLAIGMSASIEPTAAQGDSSRANGGAQRRVGNGTRRSDRAGGTWESGALVTSPRRKRMIALGIAIAGGFGLGCLVGMRRVQ